MKNSSDLRAKCIVGTVYDEKMQEDEVKVTLIATGFDMVQDLNDIIIKKENKFMRWITDWF